MKTITICDKEYQIDCNAFTRFEYKNIFGKGIFQDIKLLSNFSKEQETKRANTARRGKRSSFFIVCLVIIPLFPTTFSILKLSSFNSKSPVGLETYPLINPLLVACINNILTGPSLFICIVIPLFPFSSTPIIVPANKNLAKAIVVSGNVTMKAS